MARTKLILASVGIVLVAIVVLQNTAAVETKFLFMSVTMPRAVLLCITFLAGLAVGFILATGTCTRKSDG